MHAATARYHWLRCRHHLQLQLPQPLSPTPFSSSRSRWIWNDRAGFWIRDGGRQVLQTAEWGGSASNAECRAGYNATCCVCLWGSSVCWCATTACNQHGGWSRYWPSLCCWRGRSHPMSDICIIRIVQRRWEGGVVTLECRGYGTPSLRGIPHASQYGNASLRRAK